MFKVEISVYQQGSTLATEQETESTFLIDPSSDAADEQMQRVINQLREAMNRFYYALKPNSEPLSTDNHPNDTNGH